MRPISAFTCSDLGVHVSAIGAFTSQRSWCSRQPEIRNTYHVDYGSFLGGINAADVGVQADYALFAKNGWIGVKLAGSFGLDFSAKDVPGFNSAEARTEIANNIANTSAFERQSLDDVATSPAVRPSA